MVWRLVSDLLKNPEQLRTDLDAMIAFERDIACDDPEHEAKAWLNKLANLDSLVAIAPDALDALAPEERLNIYKMLELGVVMRPEGGIEASGTFVNDLTVCTSTPART